MRYIASLQLVLCFLSGPTFVYANSGSSNTVSNINLADRSLTRKAADLQCRSSFGDFPLYDVETYYDVDENPSCYVYIYSVSHKWENSKKSLMDSIYVYRRLLAAYGDSLQRIHQVIPNGSNRDQKLSEYRKHIDNYLRLSTRPDEFISIYTSASTNHWPILEYRRGLPENYVLKFDFVNSESLLQAAGSTDLEYYYLGPAKVYASQKGNGTSDLINALNPQVRVGRNDLTEYRFNKSTVKKEFSAAVAQSWDMLRNYDEPTLRRLYGSNQVASPKIIADVPYFRQVDWKNILPHTNSCVVMSAASILSYYDNKGFWNIVPWGDYVGPPDTDLAGFTMPVGVNYSVNIPGIGVKDVKFGPETMLYELATDLGYDFENGGTNMDCYLFPPSKAYDKYTEKRLGLGFQYNQDCFLGGHSYSEIKNEIDNNRPMVLVVNTFSWGSSGGPYYKYGGHVVAVVGYDESNPVGGQPVAVYINGTIGYDIVWWNYAQIQADNAELTMAVSAGGTPGSYVNPPASLSPSDGDQVGLGDIQLKWTANAGLYRVQVNTDGLGWSKVDAVGDGDYYVTTNTMSINIPTPGIYYWRVASQNANGNWCNFGSVHSFAVVPSPTVFANDYGIINLTASPITPSNGQTVIVSATLKNLGTNSETSGQTVKFYVDGAIVNETTTIPALNPGGLDPVTFNWIGTAGAHDLRIQAYLSGDENPSNDYSDVQIVVPDSRFTISPSQIEFQEGINQTSTSVLALSSVGSGTVDWTVSNDASWITLDKQSGEFSTTPDHVTLGVNSSGLNAGVTVSYTLHFQANIGSKDVVVILHVIGNNPPKLSEGTVVGPSGTDTTTFRYSVLYRDLDGNAPAKSVVVIDEVEYTMQVTSATLDYSQYTEFYFTKKLLPNLSHTFYFSFDDGNEGTARLPASGEISGPIVSPVRPDIGILQPNAGNQLADSTYLITWSAVGTAAVNLYYDDNRNPSDGYHVIAEGVPNTGSYSWDTRAFPNGSSFYVLGIINNQGVTDTSYSPLPVIISHSHFAPIFQLQGPIPIASGTQPRAIVRGDSLLVFYMVGGNSTSSDLYIKRSVNGGLTWGDSLKLNTVAGASYPSIVYSAGTVYIAWEQYNTPSATDGEVCFSQSSFGIDSWSTPLVVSAPDNLFSGDPQIVSTADYVTIVWWQRPSAGSKFQLFRRQFSKAVNVWGNQLQITNLSDDVSENDTKVFATQGNVVVTFCHTDQSSSYPGSFGIKVITSTNQGQSFSNLIDIPIPYDWDARYPVLASYRDTLYCGWDQKTIQLAASGDAGNTWFLKSSIPNSTGRAPEAADTVDGNISIIDKAGEYYESNDMGSTWSSPLTLDANFQNAWFDYVVDQNKRFVFFETGSGLAMKRERSPNQIPQISASVLSTQVYYADSVQLHWLAVDPDGPLYSTVSLQYTNVGSGATGVIATGLPASGNFWWNVYGVDSGSYTIHASVVDTSGAVGVSTPVEIVVRHNPSVTFGFIGQVDTIWSNYQISWNTYSRDGDSTLLSKLYAVVRSDTTYLASATGLGAHFYIWLFRSIPVSDSISLILKVYGARVNEQDILAPIRLACNGGFAIDGYVLRNGRGISGMTISMNGTVQDSAASDSIGHYAFAHLPRGVYTLRPTPPSRLTVVPSGQNVNLNGEGVRMDFQLYGVPSPPVPILPQDHGQLLSAVLKLTWSSSTDTSSIMANNGKGTKTKTNTNRPRKTIRLLADPIFDYQVQLSANSVFTFPILKDSTTYDTSMTINGDSIGMVPPKNYWWRVRSTSLGGTSDWSSTFTITKITGVGLGKKYLPQEFFLDQNYPNPFNPTTSIRFALPKSSYVTLKVFNLLGQQVAGLVNGELQAGYHDVTWDASKMPSGMYFYRIQAGGFVDTKKLLLVK